MRGKTARRCAWTRPRWRRGKEKGANGCCRVGGVCRNGAVTPYFVATRRSLCHCFLAQGCSAGFPPFCPADRNNASRGGRNSEGAGEVHCATRRWCPVVSVDETAVAEREGKRSSTGHMNVAGWARGSAPWRLYKWRLQCCAHGTVPHVPAPTVAISTLKAPFAPTPLKRVFFSGRSQRPSLFPKRQQIIWPVLFTASFFGTRRSLLRLFLSGRSQRPS